MIQAPQKSQRAFTLLELLIVVMVIGMLITISIPAISALTTSSGLNTSARKVSNLIELARSRAIAGNTLTRFGVATDWPGDASEAYKKCAIWEWDRDTLEFKQVQSWETLPGAVYFEFTEEPNYLSRGRYAERNRSTTFGDFLLSSKASNAEFETDLKGDPVTVRYIDFKANGRVKFPGASGRNVILVLVNGAFDGGESLTYLEQGSGGEPTNWAQINVDQLTGRPRIYRP
ncbi:MAG: prepilin-type N-terminal cleavage/methylation domain-containing protein [Verrucomicrobiota bacterium]